MFELINAHYYDVRGITHSTVTRQYYIHVNYVNLCYLLSLYLGYFRHKVMSDNDINL